MPASAVILLGVAGLRVRAQPAFAQTPVKVWAHAAVNVSARRAAARENLGCVL
ncbi:hypothetical protein VFPBJ_00401 [Purpureocillium lilacinum]|uniref:Uncharacterized protein n=1 Tax=Purpureocillium lilacinum TaxID=33203 RepID=A0A179HA06_PURLI|nr:hypothetical protein VFPBJ_00401 [Purpureocillium lilacinum]